MNIVSTIVAHKSGIFAISGVGHSSRYRLTQLRAMRDSFRIVEQTDSDDKMNEPALIDFTSMSGASGRIGSQLFSPEGEPISLQLPSGEIHAEEVGGFRQYRWTGPLRQGPIKGVAAEIKLFVVPRSPNLSEIEAIEEAKQRIRPMPPDSIQVANVSDITTTCDGHETASTTFEIPAQKTRNHVAYIADSSAVYVLLAVGADDSWPNRKWDEVLASVRFSK
ncbi:hypothetical protein [Blastopirellula retiformator]|nr:hypothetical protein [Blastopirellula retiformator]